MTVVILAPHPDDESIGCGGAIRLAADRGERVVVAFLTSGEAGVPGREPMEARAIREEEAENAAGLLGIARTAFLRGRDWGLREDARRIWPALRAILEEEEPSAIYLPHTDDAHPDHQSAWRVLARALPHGFAPELPAYEVWTPLGYFDDVVDVTDVMDVKLAAIRCHRSQIDQLRYDSAAEGLGSYRGALAGGSRYAEVFRHEDIRAARIEGAARSARSAHA